MVGLQFVLLFDTLMDRLWHLTPPLVLIDEWI